MVDGVFQRNLFTLLLSRHFGAGEGAGEAGGGGRVSAMSYIIPLQSSRRSPKLMHFIISFNINKIAMKLIV